jgi:hypothetical protein
VVAVGDFKLKMVVRDWSSISSTLSLDDGILGGRSTHKTSNKSGGGTGLPTHRAIRNANGWVKVLKGKVEEEQYDIRTGLLNHVVKLAAPSVAYIGAAAAPYLRTDLVEWERSAPITLHVSLAATTSSSSATHSPVSGELTSSPRVVGFQ